MMDVAGAVTKVGCATIPQVVYWDGVGDRARRATNRERDQGTLSLQSGFGGCLPLSEVDLVFIKTIRVVSVVFGLWCPDWWVVQRGDSRTLPIVEGRGAKVMWLSLGGWASGADARGEGGCHSDSESVSPTAWAEETG